MFSEPTVQHTLYANYREDRQLPSGASSLDRRSRLFLERRFGALLAPVPRGRVLELGCGDGTFLIFLRQQGFTEVAGVDLSESQIRAAHERGLTQARLGDNLAFLRQHENDFSLIVALDVIEHYTKPDVLSLMRAAHAALGPSGTLLIQTPNADGPFGARHRYADFSHELAFTPTSVTQMLRSVGFIDTDVRPVEPVVHGLRSAFRWCVWKTIRLGLVLYLAAETGCPRGHILTQNMIVSARKP
jgi:2-polyprenyl-3-methyl-5-hydroxy-6-metoxy-1,4-benzoquinol methylase